MESMIAWPTVDEAMSVMVVLAVSAAAGFWTALVGLRWPLRPIRRASPEQLPHWISGQQSLYPHLLHSVPHGPVWQSDAAHDSLPLGEHPPQSDGDDNLP